jgi:hypothetical protein
MTAPVTSSKWVTPAWLALVAILVLLLVVGCDHDANQCACPASGQLSATIALACPVPTATIAATGPCSASLASPEFVLVTAREADGACQVEVTAPDGSTASVTFQVSSTWLACGSDPHGCGQAIAVTPGYVNAGAPCEGGGPDGGTTD